MKKLKGVCTFYSETGTEGGYWAFQDAEFMSPPTQEYPSGQWSYKGLHLIEDGDELTIYVKENPDEVVWSGTISLMQHELLSEHASGFWIHADQEGVDRETWATWFLKEYPAQLVKRESQGEGESRE